MDLNVFLLIATLSVLYLMQFLFDVNYFIRAIFTILSAKFFRKRIKFLGKSELYGMVLSTDADLLLTHMNNARVFREFDFCRYDHTQRSGLLKILLRQNGGGVVSTQTCRYRRPLHMFMTYKIETRPVYYEAKSIIFEHKVISLRDGIIRCIGHVKLAFSIDIEKTVAKYFPDTIKPQLPKDLELWLDYNRVNSERLKTVKKRSRSLSQEKKVKGDEDQVQKLSNEVSESEEVDKMLNNIDNKLS